MEEQPVVLPVYGNDPVPAGTTVEEAEVAMRAWFNDQIFTPYLKPMFPDLPQYNFGPLDKATCTPKPKVEDYITILKVEGVEQCDWFHKLVKDCIDMVAGKQYLCTHNHTHGRRDTYAPQLCHTLML
jgi:hypothetical protein